MTGFALDTNAVSALFEGDDALVALLGRADRLSLPVIVVGEYRYGLQRSRHRRQLESLLQQLVAASEVLTVGLETTVVSAQTRERLRARGRPLPENDVWIAALCLEHDLELVTRDGDFEHVEGLRTASW
ncbi:MAG: type II toxin-antitoxin system VapC family toxin [Myxococcales bacterium]|nr:type II toxin-antitoxin system VapC family toxin [Myxococcales bacterium]